MITLQFILISHNEKVTSTSNQTLNKNYSWKSLLLPHPNIKEISPLGISKKINSSQQIMKSVMNPIFKLLHLSKNKATSVIKIKQLLLIKTKWTTFYKKYILLTKRMLHLKAKYHPSRSINFNKTKKINKNNLSLVIWQN